MDAHVKYNGNHWSILPIQRGQQHESLAFGISPLILHDQEMDMAWHGYASRFHGPTNKPRARYRWSSRERGRCCRQSWQPWMPWFSQENGDWMWLVSLVKSKVQCDNSSVLYLPVPNSVEIDCINQSLMSVARWHGFGNRMIPLKISTFRCTMVQPKLRPRANYYLSRWPTSRFGLPWRPCWFAGLLTVIDHEKVSQFCDPRTLSATAFWCQILVNCSSWQVRHVGKKQESLLP